MSDAVESPKIRWWPAAVTLSLFLVGLIILWGLPDVTQAIRANGTLYGGIGVVFLLLLWFLFLSKLVLKIKLIGLGCLAALGLFLYSSVEIREVSGDVLPILAWSWTPRPDEGLANRSVTADGSSKAAATLVNDYPRFLGPHNTGEIQDIHLDRDWAGKPPVEKWRIPVGEAWSGFAVKGGLAVTQEQRGEAEMVTCYALASGELVWAHGDPRRFATTVGGNGPRATPTIAGDKVYSVGALGVLTCLELTTGKLIWQKDLAAEHKAEKPRWGYSSSPLVIAGPTAESESQTSGELVVVSPGGSDGQSLVAYHAASGVFAWAGGSARPGYSSPQLVTLAGAEMILIFNDGTVAGHDPADGRVLWEVPWPGGKACVANPRCLPGDRVLVSAGYGRGAKMYQITARDGVFGTEIIYESPRLKAKFANFVLRGDHAYGLDDGVLTCFALASGERVWKKGRYGHGQLLLVGELLLLQSEAGELHLLEAQPDAHKSLGSMPVLSGKSWNSMALAGNYLLMRNHKEAVCLELSLD